MPYTARLVLPSLLLFHSLRLRSISHKAKLAKPVFILSLCRYWLYGDKGAQSADPAAGDGQSSGRVRGWFPRRCAVELAESLDATDSDVIAKTGRKKESKKAQ